MSAQYSFLDKDKASEPTRIDFELQKKINLGVYIIWGVAGLLGIYAFFVVKYFVDKEAPAELVIIFGLLLFGITVASAIAGNLVKKRDDRAWMLLRIAGILSLPAGLILLITGAVIHNILKKVEDQEFQEMLNRSKQQP